MFGGIKSSRERADQGIKRQLKEQKTADKNARERSSNRDQTSESLAALSLATDPVTAVSSE
jgi:hypothetical protein